MRFAPRHAGVGLEWRLDVADADVDHRARAHRAAGPEGQTAQADVVRVVARGGHIVPDADLDRDVDWMSYELTHAHLPAGAACRWIEDTPITAGATRPHRPGGGSNTRRLHFHRISGYRC